MINLIYVSSATKEMTEDELLLLLEQSRARNLRQNVTGMLLYAGGNFIQVLEGAEKDVKEIYEAIISDDRNSGNLVLEKKAIEERAFPNWSMGFKNLSKNDVAGYTDFLNVKMSPREIANRPDTATILLFSFKENIK